MLVYVEAVKNTRSVVESNTKLKIKLKGVH